MVVSLIVLILSMQLRHAWAIDESSTSLCDSDDRRTIFDIIWSCLATILACTWVSIHPDLPGRDDSHVTVALQRGKLAVLALVAPELTITWAIRQWIAAHRAHQREFCRYCQFPTAIRY